MFNKRVTLTLYPQHIAKLSQAQAQLGLSWLYFHITQPPPPTRESLFWTQLAFNLAHSNSANQPAHAIASHKLVLVDSLASCVEERAWHSSAPACFPFLSTITRIDFETVNGIIQSGNRLIQTGNGIIAPIS